MDYRADPWDWSLVRRRCMVEAARILDCPQDIEEAAQEALLRAWRGRRGCRTPDAPGAWCGQIARNEALRIVGRPRTATLDDLEGEEIADRATFGECNRAIRRVDVDRAIRKLAPDERLLIGLRYVYDWSQPEIARQLGIPEGTAKVRLHRARGQLKNLMAEHN